MDPLERLVEDFSKELTPDGWTVLLRPGLGTPDKEGEHMEVVFKHPLVGERGCPLPGDWTIARHRERILRVLGDEVRLVHEAPPMSNPGKIGNIRVHFSGFQWNAQMRKEVAMMLIAIDDITQAEAEWLIRAGTPTGSKRTE